MTNSLWTPSLALDSYLTATYLPLTTAILPSMPSPVQTSVQVMALVFNVILPSHMWPPPQAIGSGSMNNPWPRIGTFGCRLFNWPLDPSSLLQFFWVAGFGPHINHLSTSLMTHPLTHFTNLATMASGRSSQSSLMPWSPIALPATTTPVLLPQFQPLHSTLP